MQEQVLPKAVRAVEAVEAGETGVTKRKLPDTRESLTHHVIIYSQQGDVDVYITKGMYEDGAVGELFISIGKQGSTMRGALDSWARMLSIALQWGVPLEDVIRKFKNVSFEPNGKTDNKLVPECHSVIDYAMRWLEEKSDV